MTVQHAVPTIFQFCQFAAAGGLMGYGGSTGRHPAARPPRGSHKRTQPERNAQQPRHLASCRSSADHLRIPQVSPVRRCWRPDELRGQQYGFVPSGRQRPPRGSHKRTQPERNTQQPRHLASCRSSADHLRIPQVSSSMSRRLKVIVIRSWFDGGDGVARREMTAGFKFRTCATTVATEKRLAPPAQIRTCGFPAYGSHLGYRRQFDAVCEPTPCITLIRR